MSVSNGEKADDVNFNSSFMSREIDTSTAGRVDLDNADAASGLTISNIQKELNGQDSFITDSTTVNTSKDRKPSWLSNTIGVVNQGVKERVEAVQTQVETNIIDIAANAAAIVVNAQESADIRTTQGTSNGDTEMGTFPGTVISDNVSSKVAITEIETDLELKIYLSEKGAANGVAELDGTGKVPTSQLPTQLMEFLGNWNASTNTPTLANTDIDKQGSTYRVNVAGTTDFGAGGIIFEVGDWVYNTGSVWEKGDNIDQVTLDNAVTLTNKTMDANSNTFSNFAHGVEVDNPSSGVHGVTGNVVGTTDAQVITNKDIDGGTATNTNRITLPKDTTVNLDALTDKEGTLAYDTTLGAPVINDGAVWNELGGGGGGSSLPVARLISGGVWTNTEVATEVTTAESLTDNNDLPNSADTLRNGQSFLTTSAGDLSSCFFRMRRSATNVGGSITVNFFTALPGAVTIPVATSDSVLVSSLGTVDGNIVFNFSTPPTLLASTTYYLTIDISSVSFTGGSLFTRVDTGNPYAGGSRLFSNNPSGGWSVIGSQDLHFNVKVLGGSAPQLSFTEDAFVQVPGITDGSNKIVSQSLTLLSNQVAYVTPSLIEQAPTTLSVTIDDIENVPQETSYIIARHDDNDIIVGDSMRLEYGQSQQIYGDGIVPGAIITEWEAFTPTGSLTTNVTYTGYKRRVGDTLEVNMLLSFSGANTQGIIDIDIPDGLTIDTNKITNPNSNGGAYGALGSYHDATGQIYHLTAQYFTATTMLIRNILASGSYGVYVNSNTSTNVPVTVASGDRIELNFSVPIVGWSSGALFSTTETLFSTVKANANDANNTITGAFSAITWATEVKDDFNNFDPSTGIFTVPKTGWYTSNLKVLVGGTIALNSTLQIQLVKNTGTSVARDDIYSGGSVTQLGGAINYTDYYQEGDTLEFRIRSSITSPVYGGAGIFNYASFEESPDFSTFSIFGETELVESKAQPNVSWPITAAQWGDLTSIVLSSGEWDITAQFGIRSIGAWTGGRIDIAITETAGNSTTGMLIGDNMLKDFLQASGGSGYEQSTAVSNYNVVINSNTTFYLKGLMGAISNLNLDGYRISARRIK